MNALRYIATLLLLIGLSNVSFAGITDKLREQVKPLAKTIQQIIKEEGQASLAVGEFSGPAQFHSNFGNGLQSLLIQELESIQPGIVQASSVLSVKGDYELIKKKDLKVVEISLTVKKNNGEKITKLTKDLLEQPVKIEDSELIASMTGRTIELPPQKTRTQLNEKIQENIENPTFHKSNNVVRTSSKSSFGVEILATSATKAPKTEAEWTAIQSRPVNTSNGEPLVAIDRDEVYAIKLHNFTKHEAAVAIHIDGLDVFTFSEIKENGRHKLKYFIIGPGETIVTGWHRTNEESASFLVTEFGKGAISKLPNVGRGKVGVITASFALAWTGNNVPADEKGTRNASGNETGFGPAVQVKQEEVKRNIGVVREIVSIRYSR